MSIWEGRGLRFSRKGRTFEVNKLCIIWLFAFSLKVRNWRVGITRDQCPRVSNQRVRYIDCKHKPCNKLFILLYTSNITKNIISLSIVIIHFFLAMFHDFAY